MGYLLIATAASLISIGSYIISSSLGVERSTSASGFINGINFFTIFLGILLNFIGSLFWATGRAEFEAYFHAWNVYLLLLVIFGVLISVLVKKDPISLVQCFGVVLAAISISLISRG